MNEQQQIIIEIRKMRLNAHNCRQAYEGAVHRKRQLAGKVKALKDQVRQQEENLRKLENQLPDLKHNWEQADEQLLKQTEAQANDSQFGARGNVSERRSAS
jgi:phage shock protein A